MRSLPPQEKTGEFSSIFVFISSRLLGALTLSTYLRWPSKCDGQRPTCEHCLIRDEICVYQERRATGSETNGAVIEVIRLLNKMPKLEHFELWMHCETRLMPQKY
jgi:hypothetical protein